MNVRAEIEEIIDDSVEQRESWNSEELELFDGVDSYVASVKIMEIVKREVESAINAATQRYTDPKYTDARFFRNEYMKRFES